MIDIHIPASLEYNTANASLLATALKNLHSFDEIADWSKKAMAEEEVMHFCLRAIEQKQQTAVQGLLLAQQEYNAKSFINKLFDARIEQKRWLAEQARLAREKAQIENLIDQFESAIDFMPDTFEDLKELINKCKQQKEDLLAEKKAVNIQMSSIRGDARQQTANTNYGTYGKGDRRRIKLNKESALRPQASQKVAIERQIIQLDQMIIWLEKFE